MRTIVPKQLSIHRNSVLLFLEIPKITSMKQLLLLLVLALFSVTISAQENRMSESILQVDEVNAFIASHQPAVRTNTNTFSIGKDVDELIHKVQPAAYYYSGVAKNYGEKPKSLFTDIASLSGLSNSTVLKNNIEIATIRISSASELESTIDLSLLSAFKNLKYIYIISTTPTTTQNIMRMIRNYDEKYSVFYKIDKGDNNQ